MMRCAKLYANIDSYIYLTPYLTALSVTIYCFPTGTLNNGFRALACKEVQIEEIINSWDSTLDLVFELATPDSGPDGQPNQLKKVRKLMSQPSGKGEDFNFRLVDARGRRIQFPVKLISNTTFEG